MYADLGTVSAIWLMIATTSKQSTKLAIPAPLRVAVCKHANECPQLTCEQAALTVKVACVIDTVYLAPLWDGDVWVSQHELANQGVQREPMGALHSTVWHCNCKGHRIRSLVRCQVSDARCSMICQHNGRDCRQSLLVQDCLPPNAPNAKHW